MDKCEIIERLKNIAEHAVYTVGEKPFVMSLDDGIAVHEAIELLKKPETNCSEIPNNSDTISRQMAIDALDKRFDKIPMGQTTEILMLRKDLRELPSAQPERTCVNCGRTANNGGWYADGRTRCPIEEHYALPKDGFCHLWEKRNVTDDDYPERREE